MNEQSAGHEELPRTPYLDHTLRRARTAAEQRSHRYVTLEHLLLALLDDPDAATLLQATGADVAVIRSIAADAVNNRMASLVGPRGRQPSFSYSFDSLFQCANENAKALGRREIDGASALIAIAEDAESNASVILAANGFNPEAALKLMKTPPPAQRAPQPPRNFKGQDQKPAKAEPSRPPSAALGANLTAGDASMEDMMASVRTILESEELKEREHLQRIAPAPCPEPQVKRNGLNGGQAASRAEPGIGPSKPAKRHPHDAPRMNGFSKAPAPAPKTQKRAAPPRSAAHGRAGNVALLAKILENIPRKARAGVPQQARISISREEAGLIFGQLSRQPQQAAGTEAACRAVTVRLTAPEGAFFIEALTHETQWLSNRPAGEASGNWAWTAVPAAPGSHGLKVSISARDLDASGPGAMIALPDQTIKVRVGGNFWLALGRFARAVFLMLAGSGLTITGYYAWKIAVKLH
ncbi:MAG: Clp protease N-terminal domain-containing protein [Rhodomicrobium sp.]